MIFAVWGVQVGSKNRTKINLKNNVKIGRPSRIHFVWIWVGLDSQVDAKLEEKNEPRQAKTGKDRPRQAKTSGKRLRAGQEAAKSPPDPPLPTPRTLAHPPDRQPIGW